MPGRVELPQQGKVAVLRPGVGLRPHERPDCDDVPAGRPHLLEDVVGGPVYAIAVVLGVVQSGNQNNDLDNEINRFSAGFV